MRRILFYAAVAELHINSTFSDGIYRGPPTKFFFSIHIRFTFLSLFDVNAI